MPIVSIEENGKEYHANNEETILDALSKSGHTLPTGCLAGSCGICKIEVTKGLENLSMASAVEQNTLEALHDEDSDKKLEGKNIRLACRAKVNGDITIRPL